MRKAHNLLGPMVAVLIPLVLFIYLRTQPTMDFEMVMPKGHFYFVTSIALLATVIAILVGIAGSRLRNIQVLFLSLGYISLALVFTVHGLSTPGFMMESSSLPGVAAELSVFLAAIWIWLSSLSSDHAVVVFLSHWQRFLIPIWILLLVLAGVISLYQPHIMDFIYLKWALLSQSVAAVTIFLNILTMYRYYQSYSYSRFPLQISIVYSTGWLIVAQIIIASSMIWWFSWWLYHYLLFGSMIVMLVGLFRQYVARKSLIYGIKSLFATDPAERIAYSITPSVRTLILAVEAKSPYTAGHSFRVTMYALRLAQKLKFPPDSLRVLVQGAMIHDVGKISIPDQILNYPGKLSLQEMEIIKEHPLKGYEMCKNLGFMKDELDIIRHHHEKWDGTGYPDRLKGTEIPQMARVITVADVYDALASSRAYREAWTHDKAMNFLIEQKGIYFDPEFVDAWIDLCAEDPEVYLYPLKRINEQGIILMR